MSESHSSGARSSDLDNSQRRAAEAMDTPEVAERRYVSYAVAERMFGLSRTTLWRHLNLGHIEGVKVGRTLRLSVASIEEFMEARKV